MFGPRFRPTLGERNNLIAIGFLAFMGAVLACTITARLSADPGSWVSFDPFTMWTFCAGAIGALAGFFSANQRWLGFPGTAGWIRALFGGVVISAVGSVVGGTLILPYYGTMFGPFQLVIAMITYPALGIAWLATLAGVHRLLMPWRYERDSIFVSRMREPIV